MLPEELIIGHAIAQVDTYWLPTMVAWVRFQSRSCGICGGQSGWNWGRFLQVLWFSLPVFIPPTAPHSVTIPSFMLYKLDADECFYITN
jgi:hypothetical protein